MPVDSFAKRTSLMSMGRPFTPRLPLPDGSFANPEDRQQLIFRYAFTLTPVIAVIGNLRSTTFVKRARMEADLAEDE